MAIANLAIAQPLFEVLKNSPELFTAHQASGLDVVVFSLLVSLGLSLPCLLVVGMSRINSIAARILDFLLLGSFLVFLVLYGLNQLAFNQQPILVLILAVSLWGAINWIKVVDLWVQFLAIGGLVFPLLFLIHENIRPLIIIDRVQYGLAGNTDDPPVVLLVFDQLPTAALIDSRGEIDAERYPNFAELASKSHWFRNTTATAQDTITSIPAILTGTYTGESRTPNITTYPNNLFTLLADSYQLNAIQHATDLSPIKDSNTFAAMLWDVGLVYSHIILSDPTSWNLPSVEDRPAHFWQKGRTQFIPTDLSEDRFERFFSGLNDEDAWIHYLHIDLPHGPYRFHASGQRYTWDGTIPGLEAVWGWWGNDELPVLKAQQRYLAQLQLADVYLGKILEKLKNLKSFDRSLIVLTSDHGASFRTGNHTRAVVGDNYLDILYVPLFVKLPGQEHMERNDRNVETVDIVPTIIDVIGGDIPWKIDGLSVFGGVEKTHKFAYTSKQGKTALHDFYVKGGEFGKIEPMGENFVWSKKKRWNRIESVRDEFLGKPISENYFYPADPNTFTFDPSLPDDQARFEFRSGWIRGVINAPNQHEGAVDVAVVDNGIVIAVTRTFQHLDTLHYIAELIPTEIGENVSIRIFRPAQAF